MSKNEQTPRQRPWLITWTTVSALAVTVGLITAAGIGVLTVPGWVQMSQDSAATGDVDRVSIAETAADNLGYGYLSGGELGQVVNDLKVEITPSNGVTLCVSRDADRSTWAAVAHSRSGTYFARTAGEQIAQGATADAALKAAGGLPAGVPAPLMGDECAPGAAG